MRHGDASKQKQAGTFDSVAPADDFSEKQLSKIKDQKTIEWKNVNRVLIVRLRSIGDTVLSTSSLTALRRFLPDAQIDVLLEDWVAPVLDGFDQIDNVLKVDRSDLKSRLHTARKIRRSKYDVAFNLHGGTTATFFVRASGARHRVGFENYQYNFFYNNRLTSASDFWRKKFTHSAEQQLALLGFVGVPVEDKPKSRLVVTEKALSSLEKKFNAKMQESRDAKAALPKNENNLPANFVLFHPAAAFAEKQWATKKFARVAEFLSEKNLQIIAVATAKEREVLNNLEKSARVPILTFDNLSLPEITALASKAGLFVGNDSGIAHIAAAVQTPTVVVFGASNINHWRPWTNAPNEIVYSEKMCGHDPGEIRKGSENPKCISCVEIEDVINAIGKVLS